MATVSAKVFEHHKSDRRYIDTVHNHRVVRNSLVDYFKRDAVSVTEINSNMLLSYERYLRSERTMIRPNGQKISLNKPQAKDYQIVAVSITSYS